MSVKIELVNYFKEGVSMDNDINSLKKSLINAGHPESDVNDSFLSFSATQKTLPTFPNHVKNSEEKERPIGVKIVAYLHWLMPIESIIMFIFYYMKEISQLPETEKYLVSFLSPVAMQILFVVLFLFLSIIPIVVGRGIYKGKNDDRVFAIVISCIVFISTMSSIIEELTFSGIYWLFLSISIFYFLVINKKTKGFFNK